MGAHANRRTVQSKAGDRYIVVDESVSRSYCFTHSIVDTEDAECDEDNGYREAICECYGMDHATLICEALNNQVGRDKRD